MPRSQDCGPQLDWTTSAGLKGYFSNNLVFLSAFFNIYQIIGPNIIRHTLSLIRALPAFKIIHPMNPMNKSITTNYQNDYFRLHFDPRPDIKITSVVLNVKSHHRNLAKFWSSVGQCLRIHHLKNRDFPKQPIQKHWSLKQVSFTQPIRIENRGRLAEQVFGKPFNHLALISTIM